MYIPEQEPSQYMQPDWIYLVSIVFDSVGPERMPSSFENFTSYTEDKTQRFCIQAFNISWPSGDSHRSGDEVEEGERRAPGRRWGMPRWRSGDNLFSLLKGV